MSFNPAKSEGSILAGTDCAELLRIHYGLSNVTLTRQSGWMDVTYLVEPQNGQSKTVFKVFMDVNTSTVEAIEAEIDMLNYMSEKGFVVPKPIKTSDGKYWSEADFEDEKQGKHKKRFRMATFIEGTTLGMNINPALSGQLGDLSGRVVVALADFKTTYPKELDFLINPAGAYDIKKLAMELPERQKALATKVLELYQNKVAPRLTEFPVQQIHCDMHGANLICDENRQKIVGLIDFADSKHTLRSIEAAICLGYILMFSSEPVNTAENYMKAFAEHVKLTQLEKETLLIITAMRQVQIMAIINHSALKMPNFDPAHLERMHGRASGMIERMLESNSDEATFFENLKSA